GFVARIATLQRLNDSFYAHGRFGHHHDFGPAADGARNGDVTRVAAHYFYKKAAVVRVGRVADFINRLQCRVYRRVVADGVVSAVQVVINRARRAHGRNAELLLEDGGARK
nr:hypothetical protein [Tanacetum cinerariifolium]